MEDFRDSLMIGIDVGATKIAGALVTSNGQVLAARREYTRAEEGITNVVERITKLANELIDHSFDYTEAQLNQLMGIGIGIPGQVDSKNGVVRDAVNLGWSEVHLVSAIQKGLVRDVPVLIDTDANASTLGEFYFGAARDYCDFIFINIGSGLGAGIFINGRLVKGTTWKAAELGHISLDVNGLLCKCGLRGCPETIVSGPGLLHLVTEYLEQSKYSSRFKSNTQVTTKEIISAANDGDDLALAAFSEMGRHLGFVIAICLSILNPALIVIGGGLGLASFELVIPSSKQEIKRRVFPSLHSHLKIIKSQLESSAIGAASLVLIQDLGSN